MVVMGCGRVDHRLDPLPEGEVLGDAGEEGFGEVPVGVYEPGGDDRVLASMDLVVGITSPQVGPGSDRVDDLADDAHRAVLDHFRRGGRQYIATTDQDAPVRHDRSGGVWKS